MSIFKSSIFTSIYSQGKWTLHESRWRWKSSGVSFQLPLCYSGQFYLWSQICIPPVFLNGGFISILNRTVLPCVGLSLHYNVPALHQYCPTILTLTATFPNA